MPIDKFHVVQPQQSKVCEVSSATAEILAMTDNGRHPAAYTSVRLGPRQLPAEVWHCEFLSTVSHGLLSPGTWFQRWQIEKA